MYSSTYGYESFLFLFFLFIPYIFLYVWYSNNPCKCYVEECRASGSYLFRRVYTWQNMYWNMFYFWRRKQGKMFFIYLRNSMSKYPYMNGFTILLTIQNRESMMYNCNRHIGWLSQNVGSAVITSIIIMPPGGSSVSAYAATIVMNMTVNLVDGDFPPFLFVAFALLCSTPEAIEHLSVVLTFPREVLR